MKKISFLLCAAALTFPALAANGGFIGPGSQQTQAGATHTSAEVKTLADDTKAVLEGHLIRQIDREHYEFRDASGTLTVEIDDKKWQGQNVTPQDKVRLEGEVDRDGSKVEFDVKRVTRQ